ncbi:putative glycosyltransferase [Candidatus Vecturithrix granuli]|uniref:Putative glycosyltransferase n=1 Tax=Vecturithrix granuli TaxID=1499967 RepID=A0A081BZY0_VECG1|nr:putative glycosyltransferase [Candidatus Vecturithrix granuli]
MRIVMGLYYYFPYVSGLSVYTKHLAEALVENGYEVTVITSCYDRSLDKEQTMNGVRVIRVPVLLRLNKGVLMPTFVPMLYQHGKKADILLLHLPLAEASVITRLFPRKVLINYICDIRLNGRGIGKTLLEYLAYQSMKYAIKTSAYTVAMSFDYAANSKVLAYYLEKVVPVPPPIKITNFSQKPMSDEYFSQRTNIPKHAKVIGFLGRIVYEKGIDFLIHAFDDLRKKHDNIYLVIAGDYTNVMGGSIKYVLNHFLEGREEQICFTGRLTDDEVDAFYRFIDVLVLPSIDPLEAYGMVQVEAMLRGTPVVASDMPGVRMAVQVTKMGKIVPRKDPHALASAIEQVIYNKEYTLQSPEEIVRLLELGTTVEKYECLFRKMRQSRNREERESA